MGQRRLCYAWLSMPRKVAKKTKRPELVALCRRGKSRLKISLLELPLPSPPPKGAEWIEAFQRWRARHG